MLGHDTLPYNTSMGSRYFHVLLWLPVYMYMVQLVQSGVSRYHHYLSDGNYKGVFWRRMDIIEYTPHLVWVKKVINQCMGVYLAKMGVHQPADLVIFLESATYDHTTAAVSGCHIWGLCIRERVVFLFCFVFLFSLLLPKIIMSQLNSLYVGEKKAIPLNSSYFFFKSFFTHLSSIHDSS